MNTTSFSFLCCINTRTLALACSSVLSHAVALQDCCSHVCPSPLAGSLSAWIWKCRVLKWRPPLQPWASWLTTCLIELCSNNLQHISGLPSVVLMSETGEGQILPFSPIAPGRIYRSCPNTVFIWKQKRIFIQTSVVTARVALHIWDVSSQWFNKNMLNPWACFFN